MKKIFLALCLILSACASTPPKPDKDDRQIPSFGVKFDLVPADNGYKLEVVFPYLTAWKAGLKNNDVLIALNGKKFEKPKKGDVEKFVKQLSELKIGDPVKWTVMRDKQTLDFDMIVHGRTFNYGNIAIDPNLDWPRLESPSSLQKEVEAAQKKADFKENLSDLEQRFSELGTEADNFRLPVVEYLQRHPFQIQAAQKAVYGLLKKCDPNKITECLQKLDDSFELHPSKTVVNPIKNGLPLLEKLQAMEKVLIESDKTLNKAFSKLSAEELNFLKANSTDMVERFTESIYLHEDESKERREKNLHILEIMQKIQPAYFAQSLFQLTSTFTPEFARNFKKDLEDQKIDINKDIVAEYKTPLGFIVIGGTKDTNYINYSGNNILMIIDLGGDDIYPNVSANIIDIDGNDTYESFLPWTLAGAAFNSRILLDLKGNDRYTCIRDGLGASLFGASLLMDMEGNDIYRSKNLSEGMSFAGFSALVDVSGNDRYESLGMSQAVGIAGGKALLLDFAGDDSYYSKGLNPSGYMDPGQFDGWSQGVGIGLRNFVSGGVGLLYDGKGRDTFESGTFSQGGGYYFGYGLLINDGNDGNDDDTYISSRYSKGFSAHYAIGSFLEVGGNDTYISDSFVGEGMAWDLSLTLFEDMSGNDKYRTCEVCLGVAEQNSFAFFIDDKGKDSYLGSELPGVAKIVNDYHSGSSFGLFLDKGGDLDFYEKFKNNSSLVRPGYHILIDQ